MKRMPSLFLSLLCLAGCATAPRSGSAAAGVILSLQVELAREGGAPRPLSPGATVENGARLTLHAVADGPAYVYVVHYAPAGWSRLLLPATGEELAQAGVPMHRGMALDQQAGEEIFYAVATARPLSDADPRLCRALRLPFGAGGGRGDEEPPPPPEGVPPDKRGDDVAARSLPGAVSVRAGTDGVALLRFVLHHLR